MSEEIKTEKTEKDIVIGSEKGGVAVRKWWMLPLIVICIVALLAGSFYVVYRFVKTDTIHEIRDDLKSPPVKK